MEKICRFFIYFILFLVLYQYFNKVVEGHNVQSTTDCSSAQNRTDCRSKAPSCYWSSSDGKRTSGESGSCVSTGSTVSASKYHSGNHHASDHNHPIDPSIGQITGRVEDSGESQVNLSTSAMCDSHTCPDNYVKRDDIDNTLQGDNPSENCCRPATCDTFECGENAERITDPSPESVNQFDPPDAPTELPQARCCQAKCGTYTCPSTHISRGNANANQGDDPTSSCCQIRGCSNFYAPGQGFGCPGGYANKSNFNSIVVPAANQGMNYCCGLNCNNYNSCGTALTTGEVPTLGRINNALASNTLKTGQDNATGSAANACCIPKPSKDLKCGTYKCPTIKISNLVGGSWPRFYGGGSGGRAQRASQLGWNIGNYRLANPSDGVLMLPFKRRLQNVNYARTNNPIARCCQVDQGSYGHQLLIKSIGTSSSPFSSGGWQGRNAYFRTMWNQGKPEVTCPTYPQNHTRNQGLPNSPTNNGHQCILEQEGGLHSGTRTFSSR